MSEREIASGLPIPPTKARGNSKGYSRDLRRLEPGQSVWLPTTMRALTNSAQRVLGRGNYTMREEVQGGVVGVRTWRKRATASAMVQTITHFIGNRFERRDD